jgi:hypothetical protein
MYYNTPSEANEGKLSALRRDRCVLSETPFQKPGRLTAELDATIKKKIPALDRILTPSVTCDPCLLSYSAYIKNEIQRYISGFTGRHLKEYL